MITCDINIYDSQPMCNIENCLKRDYCYCMSDLHGVSPNSEKCKQKIVKDDSSE